MKIEYLLPGDLFQVPGNLETYEVQNISLDPADTFWEALNLITGKLRRFNPFEMVEAVG